MFNIYFSCDLSVSHSLHCLVVFHLYNPFFFYTGNKKSGGILQCSLQWIYSIWLLAFLHNKAFLWQLIPSFLPCQFWNIGVSVVFRDHNIGAFSSLDDNILLKALLILWCEDLHHVSVMSLYNWRFGKINVGDWELFYLSTLGFSLPGIYWLISRTGKNFWSFFITLIVFGFFDLYFCFRENIDAMSNAAINHETEGFFLSNISLCSRCKSLESGRWCMLAVWQYRGTGCSSQTGFLHWGVE